MAGAMLIGWMLGCGGTEEIEAPAPAPAPVAEHGREKHKVKAKGKGAKAGGDAVEGKFVRVDMGDLMHLVVETPSGETSFVCVDAACAAVESWSAGLPIVVEHEVREVKINDEYSEEMEVVVSVRPAS